MSQPELKLLDSKGKEVGTKAVSADVFGRKVGAHLLHQMVRWQRNKKRAGTHSTQTRAEMTGGGKKPWKQKGTGNARSGSNTSSIWVGGGIAHGPKPRSYEFRMNRKEKYLALAGAVSTRHREERVFLVQDFGLKDIKTKAAANVLGALGIAAGDRALVILPAGEEIVRKSLKNLPAVKVISPAGLNVYDVLNHKYLVIAEEAFEQTEQRLNGTLKADGAGADEETEKAAAVPVKKAAAKKASKPKTAKQAKTASE